MTVPRMMVDERKAQFGRYHLERLISRGGMGEVYLASMAGAAGFSKQVCIKRILPHLSREPEFVTRFVDEAHIVVHLTHGNIVPVLDMGEVEGDYFIAMEYIAGRDLRDIIKTYERRGERMPLPLAAWLIGELSRALSYAHKKTDDSGRPLRIIHRDVSPSNVLVSREGVIKLTDFGIAKAVSKLGKSITGRLQGKFCYMSPEQAGGESVDHRSDIFSLGTLAYELATGARAFDADTDLAILDAVKRAEVAPASSLVPEIPEAVDAVLAKALSRQPSERYSDAAALGRDLVAATASVGEGFESRMAAELERLYPDGVVAQTGGRSLDDLLAAEADALILAADDALAGTVTASAPSRPDVMLTPSRPGVPQTPFPSGPQMTPSSPYPVAEGQLTWKRSITPVAVLAIIASLVATALWAWPGYLRDGRLHVACAPADAEVLVDNVRAGLCGMTVDLPPGDHDVRVRLDRYEEASHRLTVVRGETTSIHLELVPSPWVSATIWVEDTEGRPVSGARVRTEGGPAGVSSGTPFEIEVGTYLFEATAAGFELSREMVAIGRDHLTHTIVLQPEVAPEIEGEQVVRAEPAPPDPTPHVETSPERGSSSSGESSQPRRRRLRLTDLPDDAIARVDAGEPQRASNGQITLRFAADDDETHRIVVTAEGSTPVELTYRPARDGDRLMPVGLSPAELRWVRVWVGGYIADVAIDGRPAGTTDDFFRLSTGPHRVSVHNPALDCDEERSVVVGADVGSEQSDAQTFTFCQ